MSRSGYSDDYNDDVPLQLYRGAVERAILGKRGQTLLRRLRDALDAMPVKRLVKDAIQDKRGEVCALGALDRHAPEYTEDAEWEAVPYAERLANHFNIAPALAAEIVYMNDEWTRREETPEARWQRMRAWVEKQIGPSLDESEAVEPISPRPVRRDTTT